MYKIIELEDSRCPLDCPAGDDVVLVGKDRIHNLPGEFKVVRCRTCRLMRTNSRPTQKAMSFYYPDNYGPYIGTQIDRIEKARSRFHMLRIIAKRIFILNANRLTNLKVGRMLEIGCASGGFMRDMAKKGWEVEGLEFSPMAAEAARGLGYPVHTGSLEAAPAPNLPYDLIVGWMVLEHLHEPVLSLSKLRDWAKQDAVLALSVPNAGAWQFSLFRDKWYPLQLPTHLFHFTPETAKKVFAMGGWEITHIHFQRILSDPIASLGHIFQDRGFKTVGQYLVDFTAGHEIAIVILYPLAWLLSIIGQTGRMTIWARRLK